MYLLRNEYGAYPVRTDNKENPATRANSFNYLFVDEWKCGPAAACPLFSGEIAMPAAARSIFVRHGGQLQLFYTDTVDHPEADILRVKRETCQIYMDRSGKTRDIDFMRDLVKLERSAMCGGCPSAEWCPGIYERVKGKPSAPSETVVCDVLGGLSGRVLDVGCGRNLYPDLFEQLAESGKIEYIGIDPAAGELPPPKSSKIKVVESVIEEFDGADGSFDAVLVLRSHNHFRDLTRAYGNIGRLLKPGGLLLIVDNTVFGVVRPKGFVQKPAGADAPVQHYRNDTSWDVYDFIDKSVFGTDRHAPVRPDGFNQWLISFRKRAPENVDVLIVNPAVRLHADFVDYPYFTNLGVLQNAVVLAAAGMSVRVADSLSLPDAALVPEDDDHYRLGAPAERIFEETADCRPRVVAVAKNVFNYSSSGNRYIREILEGVKERWPGAPVLLCDFYFGGMHYIEESGEQLAALYPEADCIIKYECEAALPEVVKLLLAGDGAGARVIRGNSADVKLDSLPEPDWSLIHVEQYQRTLRSVFGNTRAQAMFAPLRNTFPAATSRGCVYDCCFCTRNPGQAGDGDHGYRLARPAALKKYFKCLRDEHGAREIVVLDGLVNLNESHFTAVIDVLNSLGLKYDFPNGLRADRLKRKHLETMAGRVSALSVSAESGSQAVVDEIVVKKQPLEAVERVAKWCSELGIPLLIHYMIGLPGEGLREINETLRHAWLMKRDFGAEPSVQFATPLPGSPLHDECVAKRLLPDEPVEDYAPHFTKRPLIGTIAAPPATLVKMRERFELRKSVSRTRKVIINLTYECSNSCRFCAIGRREKNTLPLDTVVGFLAKYRAEGVRMADFDGGEPTLHTDLFEIVTAARGMGYERINVTTNGRKLASRDFTARLLLSGISDLLISIHGHNAEIHDFHTTKPGSFEETLKGLRNAVRLRPDRIDLGVNTTLTTVNAPHLTEYAEFLVREGVSKLNVQFITPFGTIEKDIVPDPAGAASHLRKAIDKFGDRLKINVINLPFCFMEGYEEYLTGDVYKNERNMVFVSTEDVNLAQWLTAGRRRTEKCGECEFAIVCDGEYQFEEIGT